MAVMTQLESTDRFFVDPTTSATDGMIRWSPAKGIWLFSHITLGALGVALFPQLDALLVFLALTALTIRATHCDGMHRLLIHRSFETPPFVEYVLAWLGTLVGMAGPIGMIKTHDLRD